MFKHLFINIPFTNHDCSLQDKFQISHYCEDEMQLFLKSIENNLNQNKENFKNLQTIYIATVETMSLTLKNWEQLFEIIRSYIKTDLESSIELHGSGIDKKFLILLKKFNWTRLVFRVFTFQKEILSILKHNDNNLLSLINLSVDNEFDNIAVDLQFNLLSQLENDLIDDLKIIFNNNIKHVSYYQAIEPDYKFDQYQQIISDHFSNSNFLHYEINSYSHNNHYSKFQIGICNNDSFLGIGPDSSSFIKKKFQLLKTTCTAYNWEFNITNLSVDEYYYQIFMMGLNLKLGINLRIKDNYYAYKHFIFQINYLINLKMLIVTNKYLKCTKLGWINLEKILQYLLKKKFM